LISLKVGFASLPGAPKIDYTLERFEEGKLCFQQAWRLDVIQAETSESDGAPPPLALPAALPDSLREAIAAAQTASGQQTPDPTEPLWLHLIKPYGLLGIAPWEQALATLLERPIFRLPDFLAKPAELEDVLEAAILWDHREGMVDDAALDAALEAWMGGSLRSTVRIHVLATDPAVRARLTERWKDREDVIAIHQPDEEFVAALPDTPPPAFGWIERATQGTTLDVLQIAASAELGPSQSTMILSGDASERLIRTACVTDLATLLNRLGAWSAVISGVPGNAAEGALRHFADSLAQARPGPVLYHSLVGARDDDLFTTCDILFAAGERDQSPLKHGFLYCTPALINGDAIEHAAQDIPSAPANDLLSVAWPSASAAETSGQAPPWVASAQRVVEEITLDHSRNVAGDNQLQNLLQQAPDIAQSLKETRSDDVVQQAIDDIQLIIRKAAVEMISTAAKDGMA